MNYREVKTSDRLPDKNDNYVVEFKRTGTTPSYLFVADYSPTSAESKDFWKEKIEWWLEPLPEISEEEIDTNIDAMSIIKKYGLESESLIGWQQVLALMEECARKAIIKLLNPEK